MDSYIDIAFHIVFSLIAGYAAWKALGSKGKRSFMPSLIAAFICGVFIGLDHFFDYILAFGTNFNYNYFINGEYFLRTGKAYILFHGFEYVIILGLMTIIAKKKKVKMIFLSLGLSMLFQLLVDILLFSTSIKFYSIVYRVLQGFYINFPPHHLLNTL